jgi:hypothetical protein
MTRGDDLNKILDMKMNTGQAEAQFNSFGMKIENLEIILNKLRMEVDGNYLFIQLTPASSDCSKMKSTSQKKASTLSAPNRRFSQPNAWDAARNTSPQSMTTT